MPPPRRRRALQYGELLLVLSDDTETRRDLYDGLTDLGYQPVVAGASAGLYELAHRLRPAVVVFDVDGAVAERLGELARLRSGSRTPVIVLSRHVSDGDKVAALDAGADDYVTKPFGSKELVGRVRVMLRYAQHEPASEETVTVGALQLDAARHHVAVGGKPVHLTPIEFRLLSVLARCRGALVRREQLLQEIWGAVPRQSDHLRVHIAALRRKLEVAPERPRLIRTVARLGYRLAIE